jgi:exosortase/archaeosortase family protein
VAKTTAPALRARRFRAYHFTGLDGTSRSPDPARHETAAVLRADTAQHVRASLDRNELFAGLFVIGFANGILIRVVNGIRARELADVLMNTFEISAILWVALFVGVSFLLRRPGAPVTHVDKAVAAGAAVAFLAPVAPLSWIALSALAIYILWTSQAGSFPHRGGWILLAMTVPMFWSRVMFSLLSDFILEFDAILVGSIVGTERAGNAIAFADGSGYLWIAPACSSLANVSLAILCWVLFTQLFHRERPLRQAWWGALACAAVVAINVARLSLIGLYREHNDLLHGPVGAAVANWLTIAAIIGICALGVRYDFSARR